MYSPVISRFPSIARALDALFFFDVVNFSVSLLRLSYQRVFFFLLSFVKNKKKNFFLKRRV